MKLTLLIGTIAAALTFVPASASASGGCGTPLTPGDQTVQLQSSGGSRPFLLYVPKGYTGREPRPLLLNLHGTLSNGGQQMQVTELREFADRDGFLVAAPDGGATAGSGHSWVVPGTTPRGEAPPGGFPDDVAYLRDVIRTVQAKACQDRAKVFVTGTSAGGRMTSAMACAAADVVTAVVADVGLRAGAPTKNADGNAVPDPKTCAPARPLPVIALHGTGDFINPYDGGGAADWQYSVPQAVARWAELLGCNGREQVKAHSMLVDELTHAGCDRYSTVLLYRVTGGGHQWFGADPMANPAHALLGLDTTEIRASDVVTDTIQRYALKTPKLTPITVTCRKGGVRVRVRATTDSPLEQLSVRVGKARKVTRTATLRKTFRIRGTKVRVRAVATDRAGLTTKRSARRTCM